MATKISPAVAIKKYFNTPEHPLLSAELMKFRKDMSLADYTKFGQDVVNALNAENKDGEQLELDVSKVGALPAEKPAAAVVEELVAKSEETEKAAE